MAREASANHMLWTRAASHFNLDPLPLPLETVSPKWIHYCLKRFCFLFFGFFFERLPKPIWLWLWATKNWRKRKASTATVNSQEMVLFLFFWKLLWVWPQIRWRSLKRLVLWDERFKPLHTASSPWFPMRVAWFLCVLEMVNFKNKRCLFQSGPSPKGLPRRATVWAENLYGVITELQKCWHMYAVTNIGGLQKQDAPV